MQLVKNKSIYNYWIWISFVCLGTSLYYVPGALTGGVVEHECSLERGIGYFLELVLYMAPFMKTSLELRLKGVTNDRDDPSVINFTFFYIYRIILYFHLGGSN